MRKFYFALLLATLVSHLPAQDFTLIADINQGTGNSATFKDNVSIYFQDKLFFSANDGINGDELWVYENSELRLVRDINAGSGGSEIQHMHIVNGRLVFVARTASHGREWWTTDGTSEGTTLLKDINPGSSHGVWVDHGYTAEGFIVFNNTLYFTGISGDDYELWKTDGTPNGTVLVRNISLNGSSLPNSYTVFNNQVYFSCREGLWRTNGTTAGTVLVRNDDPEDFFGFEPSQLFSTENFMLMIQNQDLWVSNGTRAGTFKIRDFQSISFNWIGPRFERVNGTILFAANDGVSGDELWRTDGTAQGTTLVKDVWPGANGYAPQNAVVFKDKLYYKGNNGSSDIELFVSDGTEAGTLLFRDFNSNGSGFALPSEIVADTNFIYLNAGRSFAQEIWVSDGTAANTFEININPEGQSRPTSLYLFDGKLFCFAQTDATGYEPYIIDLISQPIDEDNDGFTADVDCDDLNPAINPGQMEIPYNGLDDDCDPMTLDDDLDQDGFVLAEDCDDINPAVNPGQTETAYNGLDDDCDATTFDDDLDQDGFVLAEDCDDINPAVNPGQMETTYNGLDDDCDPMTLDDDLDQDGFVLVEDCDEINPNINPAAVDIPDNGIDEDCNGLDSLSTSTYEVENAVISIFPNPVAAELHIVVEGNLDFEARLYSLQGQLLFSGKNSSLIEVNHLASGTYLLELRGADLSTRIVERIVVRR